MVDTTLVVLVSQHGREVTRSEVILASLLNHALGSKISQDTAYQLSARESLSDGDQFVPRRAGEDFVFLASASTSRGSSLSLSASKMPMSMAVRARAS